MTTARRMGPPGSAIWTSMLEGAEDILREEGYGALTSRRVAERIGVKQRLVYYYFRTMDELIVEAFRRGAVRELERLNRALEDEHPLRAIWQVYVDTADTRLISEYMALANRIDALRAEVKQHIEACRQLHIEALNRTVPAGGEAEGLPTVVAAILATSAALTLHREAEIGIVTGHAEVMAAIESFIARRDA